MNCPGIFLLWITAALLWINALNHGWGWESESVTVSEGRGIYVLCLRGVHRPDLTAGPQLEPTFYSPGECGIISYLGCLVKPACHKCVCVRNQEVSWRAAALRRVVQGRGARTTPWLLSPQCTSTVYNIWVLCCSTLGWNVFFQET